LLVVQNDRFGEPQTQQRDWVGTDSLEYHRDIQPIFEQRCTVCHGCYDAPCQLKLEAFEGLDRGASKKTVYDGERLLAAELTRLFVDAKTTNEWRQKDFFPVLNEREQTAEANLEGSVLYQLLQLKRLHPLPRQKQLPDDFDLSLNRKQQCTSIETFDRYQQQYPLWGMPYGFPAITNHELQTIERWLEQGAKAAPYPELRNSVIKEVVQWEQFLNGQSLKQQLMSRYIYEHLFLADIYFSVPSGPRFKLVRSRTPSGQAIDQLATRRPYDPPGVSRFYYRLQADYSTVLAKTHMPYRLNPARMQRWQQLFLDLDYAVSELPSYAPEIASNPFIVFQDIPVKSRYQFMLDEAQFTIMGFIKGPVCRGQVALNVINDQFWVFFVDPNAEFLQEESDFLANNADYLRLPLEKGDTLAPVRNWLRYSRLQRQYLQEKDRYLSRLFPEAGALDLNVLWNGRERNAVNANAALTIFRHFDSASVEKGLLGHSPKTAWVIGYPLLERIHYLLVAGFDVYGNVGHQLLSRLYMDFLRMEGEFNFVNLLPQQEAINELNYWYRDAESDVKDYIQAIAGREVQVSGVAYQTQNYKAELYQLLKQHLGSAAHSSKLLSGDNPAHEHLRILEQFKGRPLAVLPEPCYWYEMTWASNSYLA
jgi:hypothetical protein